MINGSSYSYIVFNGESIFVQHLFILVLSLTCQCAVLVNVPISRDSDYKNFLGKAYQTLYSLVSSTELRN